VLGEVEPAGADYRDANAKTVEDFLDLNSAPALLEPPTLAEPPPPALAQPPAPAPAPGTS
jgi:hypothetical protein